MSCETARNGLLPPCSGRQDPVTRRCRARGTSAARRRDMGGVLPPGGSASCGLVSSGRKADSPAQRPACGRRPVLCLHMGRRRGSLTEPDSTRRCRGFWAAVHREGRSSLLRSSGRSMPDRGTCDMARDGFANLRHLPTAVPVAKFLISEMLHPVPLHGIVPGVGNDTSHDRRFVTRRERAALCICRGRCRSRHLAKM